MVVEDRLVKCPAISCATAAIEVVCEAVIQIFVGANESGEAWKVQHLDDHEKNLNRERQRRHLGS